MIQIGKYKVRTDLYYDPANHFWVDVSGKRAVIGMSPLVQETSGSFVAIQMAVAGTAFVKGTSVGSVEAEKHVGPLKAPVSGKVLVVNEKVIRKPGLINEDPYGEGWLMEVELTNADTDLAGLVSGEEKIAAWFQTELKKFDEKGWIAKS